MRNFSFLAQWEWWLHTEVAIWGLLTASKVSSSKWYPSSSCQSDASVPSIRSTLSLTAIMWHASTWCWSLSGHSPAYLSQYASFSFTWAWDLQKLSSRARIHGRSRLNFFVLLLPSAEFLCDPRTYYCLLFSSCIIAQHKISSRSALFAQYKYCLQ